jgi:hypothetical protein
MVSGFTTRDMSSRPGQIRVIHTNNARSLPYSRSRGGCQVGIHDRETGGLGRVFLFAGNIGLFS